MIPPAGFATCHGAIAGMGLAPRNAPAVRLQVGGGIAVLEARRRAARLRMLPREHRVDGHRSSVVGSAAISATVGAVCLLHPRCTWRHLAQGARRESGTPGALGVGASQERRSMRRGRSESALRAGARFGRATFPLGVARGLGAQRGPHDARVVPLLLAGRPILGVSGGGSSGRPL